MASSDDFALAEQFLKKAVALDPTDGEAWAAYALLSCGARVFGFDLSDARKNAARTQAENAIKLSPDSGQARLARAYSLRFNPQTREEAIRLLRAEAASQPTNRLVLRTLSSALRGARELEQALVYLDKAAALPGSDPITHSMRGVLLRALNRFAEAEAAFDEALAIAPNYVFANWHKLELLLEVRGDLARATAHLAKVPPAYFLDDRAAMTAYEVSLYSRDAGKCLEVMRHAKDYMARDGPKAIFTARAYRLAGNEEAARSDFKTALRLVDERLAAQTNDSVLLSYKLEILASLGERAVAEPLLREILQRRSTGDSSITGDKIAYFALLLNQRETALAALESYYRTTPDVFQSKVKLRYDPRWDPLRGDPRFEALLKAPEPKK